MGDRAKRMWGLRRDLPGCIQTGEFDMRFILAAALAGFASLCVVVSTASAATLQLKAIAGGERVRAPLDASSPPGDKDRLFVVGQRGEIRIYDRNADAYLDAPFLTVGGLGGGFEQGLLGLAFAPDYATSGKFYVSFVDADGQHHVDEYKVSADPNVAGAAPTRRIITVEHPDDGTTNHYGGWIGFSPTDGNLYITTGDSDTFSDNAQNNENLLGSILRIDVCDAECDVMGRNYNIPEGNFPEAEREEIWANGARNPFRGSFDSETGDFFFGDVGEDRIEEINVGAAGANYGWIAFEGREEFMPELVDVAEEDVTFALYEYLHGDGDFQGFSVTPGTVYRGPLDGLDGYYFFADLLTNQVWSFEFDLDTMTISNLIQWNLDIIGAPASAFSLITSISGDDDGNLYFTSLSGTVFQLVGAEVPLPGAALLMIGGLFMMRRRMKRR